MVLNLIEDELHFDKNSGLIPVIAQDWKTNEVLMQAFMNREAFQRTLHEGKAYYWSRPRQRLWMKGELSGNIQLVKEMFVDCDGDCILLKVEQVGKGACHKGFRSCFYRKKEGNRLVIFGKKVFDPSKAYGKNSKGKKDK